MTLAVILTCHNRRDVTLQCLNDLRIAAAGIEYLVYLYDDGSTDGTGYSVREIFPEVTILVGDGSAYWNGGMRQAWSVAANNAHSYYLLLNDDLRLKPGSIAQLLEFQRKLEPRYNSKVISIGKVLDADTGHVTYGGFVVAPGLSRLRFLRISDESQPCDTANGNCVLVPHRAVNDVGILSDRYTHAIGDIDFGLRARNAGYKLFQSREAVGSTSFNKSYHDKISRLNWSNWRFIFNNPKGIPVREWLHFCRAHGGPIWPVNFIWRYLKILSIKP